MMCVCAQAVSWADYATGKILDELDALGLTNDTMVEMGGVQRMGVMGGGSLVSEWAEGCVYVEGGLVIACMRVCE